MTPGWPGSARDLVSAYARREVLPSEVMAATLDWIGDVEPRLDAFVTVHDAALEHARASDEAYRAGRPRRLEGVPIAVKDAFDSAGTRTTYGSSVFADHVPAEDAEAVRLARAAGAVVVGKTSLHELCWGLTGESTIGGPARNPWALERTAGGSSGGSAAAVAGAVVPLALGTDTAGSIRLPASFCGIVGMKPTYGRISTRGVLPLAPSLDHVGVLARDPADAAVLLDVLVGSEPRRLPPLADSPLEDIAVGMGSMASWPALEPSVATAMEDVADALRGAGARVADTDLHGLDDAHVVLQTIQLAEALESHLAIGVYPGRADGYSPEILSRFERAEQLPAGDVRDARSRRAAISAALDELLTTVDVIVTPAAPCGAPLVEDGGPATSRLRELVLPFTTLQNLAGVPTCVVRAGFDDRGLPLGVQITGARGADDLVLHVARALYEATHPLQRRWPDEVTGAAAVG